jgi:hypothetical protein
MESQQMMELLLAMREFIKAGQEQIMTDRKTNRDEMKQEIRTSREQIQENLKKMLEEMISNK